MVKWALPKPYFEKARRLRDDHLAGRVAAVAPPCLWLEVASAFRKYVLRKVIEVEVAKRAVELLRQTDVEIVEVNPAEVLELALKLGVTTYDAAYIALAERLDTVFYTADEKLLKHQRAKHISQYEKAPCVAAPVININKAQ